MADIPDHLLKRAQERRAALEANKPAEGAGDAPAAAAETPVDDGNKIPAHLLQRSAAARAKTAGGEEAASGGGVATAVAPAAAPAGMPVQGATGHTQRLLTVVKAGSIQDVKATPTDKVHTWPHLLVGEFVASLACTAFLLVFSAFVNAPLLAPANVNRTPNPSKAPWYFLGLQELLTMLHPMVAGVMIPTVIIVGLGGAGYIDKNPSNKPEDRKLAIALMTLFLMMCASLTVIGSFFRGEGFNFILPWRQGIHDIFDL
ncbi:MAG: menaquinol-cytochrome c reductase cytochrome b/c subunit [Actinomycetota bacterium]